MELKEQLISEIEREAKGTRRILERIPSDQFNWQPHEKSMTLKKLAVHIASLSGRPAIVVRTDFQDLADNIYKAPEMNNTRELTDYFDKGIAESLDALRQADNGELNKNWTLRRGEHIIIEAPKSFVIRTISINHMIHHRGQLSVYLRLLDIPVPGMYGPSADERVK